MRTFTITLWLIAAFLLAGSFSFYVYSTTPKGDTDKVVIAGKDYCWDDMFDTFETEEFSAGDRDYRGIPLSALIVDSGVDSPESLDYTITGSDGYEKTVKWDDIRTGYLVKDGKITIFPELTRSFWVKGVIEINAV